jgi:hypothetical protein
VRAGLGLWLGGGSLGVALVVLACDTITLPPELTSPVNECSEASTCEAIFPEAGAPTCSSGVCVTPSGFRPVLVVSNPGNAPISPGVSVGLPNVPLPGGTKGPACQTANDCIFLPSPQLTVGQINVTGGLQGLGPVLVPGGLQPNVPLTGSQETSLPVTATFWPLWQLAPANPNSGYMLAGELGLPLNEVSTNSEPSKLVVPPEPTNSSIPSRFGQAFSVPLVGGFTLTDTTLGNYLLQLVPEEPYSMFPPYVGEVSAGSRLTLEYTLPGQGPYINATTYDVQTNAGAPSLAGWTAYAVDSHGFRITGKVALSGAANEQFTLYDATQTSDQTGQQLYVQPPAGVSLPMYVDKAAGTLLGRQISYPPLPNPPVVSVSGTVTLDGDLTRPITARIVFVADGAPDGAAVLTTDIATPYSQQLYYRGDTTTNAVGQYQITLPPGKYRTYVIPNDAALALTIQMQVVTTDAVQNGKGLNVQSRFHFRGNVQVGDGTPVYGAEVVLDPSADAPLDPGGFDPLALPRESIGSTDANGHFDVLVDPGLVDISVRPKDGTRFPWVVSTNWKVLADTTLPKAIVIPPPGDPSTTRSGGQLADAVGNPLTRTIVRAYGFPPAGPTVDGGAPSSRGARLVGMTTSDDTGRFELYVAPPDP